MNVPTATWQARLTETAGLDPHALIGALAASVSDEQWADAVTAAKAVTA